MVHFRPGRNFALEHGQRLAVGPRRGEGISAWWDWGAPYVSWAPRNRACWAIQNGRVAIVGTGFYEHYPLAYGYRYREYTALGIVWASELQWLVNNGWRSDGGAWVSAASCWFGLDGWCW